MYPVMRQRRRHIRTVFILATLLLILPSTPLAKITVWTNAAPANEDWSEPGNWDNGVPAFNDDVVFTAIGGSSVMDIPGLVLGEMNMTSYFGTLELQWPLTFFGDFVQSGGAILFGNPLDIAADLVVLGDMDADGSDFSIGGNMTMAGNLAIDNGTIVIAGDLTVDGAMSAHGAAIDVVNTVAGDPGALLDMGPGTLSFGGNGAFSGFALFAWSPGGVLIAQGSGPQSVSFPAGANLADVRIQRGGASDITTFSSAGGSIDITGALIVTSGTLDLQSSLAVAGDVNVSSAGTLRNNGTPNLDMTFGASVAVNGGTFSVIGDGGVLSFASGAAGTVTVSGTATFAVQGTLPSGRVRLQNDGAVGGPQWILSHDPAATISVNAAEVQDSDAQGGTVVATNSLDLGNNTNWDFGGPKTTTWTDASPLNSNWSEHANWDFGAPGTGDVVVFSSIGGASMMDLAGLTLLDMDMDGYTGNLVFLGPLSVMGDVITSGDVDMGIEVMDIGVDLVVQGTLTMSGTMTVGGNITVVGNVAATAGAIAAAGALTIASGSTWQCPSALDVGGSTHVDAAALFEATAGGTQIDLGGDLSVAGTFRIAAPSVRVRFAPASGVSIATGATFEIAGGPGPARVRFEQDGSAGDPQWIVERRIGATVLIDNLSVQDSDASAGQPMVAGGDSEDAGNNENWVFGGPTSVPDDVPALRLSVHAAPNPFNPATTIHYTLPHSGRVTLHVFDARGRRVRTLVAGDVPAGRHRAVWDGRDDANRPSGSGVYFCRLEAGGGRAVEKVVLLK